MFPLQIFYYSASLFKGAGLGEAEATHATSGVGGVMVVMTLVTIPLMDRAGRRSLHLVGLAGMFVFSILFTVALALKVSPSGTGQSITHWVSPSDTGSVRQTLGK